jgi:type II secretory pathway pseudopilin PulG
MSNITQPRLAKRQRRRTAFTLLEVLLAVVIATGLLSTAMYFYQKSSRFRSDLILETERIASARLILNRMSTELRSTLHHPVRNIGFKGGSNWVEFLKTEIPSEASWAMSTENSSSSAYPEAGYRLIRYELAMKNVIDTGLDNTANREMIENLNLDNNSDVAPGGDFPSLKQGDAIDRTERRLLTAKASTNSLATVRIEPVRITDQLKYMQLRYLNNGNWAENWGGPNPPAGIEISLGIDPLSVTNLLEEYTNHVYRRIVRIPTSIASITPPNETNLVEEQLNP